MGDASESGKIYRLVYEVDANYKLPDRKLIDPFSEKLAELQLISAPHTSSVPLKKVLILRFIDEESQKQSITDLETALSLKSAQLRGEGWKTNNWKPKQTWLEYLWAGINGLPGALSYIIGLSGSLFAIAAFIGFPTVVIRPTTYEKKIVAEGDEFDVSYVVYNRSELFDSKIEVEPVKSTRPDLVKPMVHVEDMPSPVVPPSKSEIIAVRCQALKQETAVSTDKPQTITQGQAAQKKSRTCVLTVAGKYGRGILWNIVHGMTTIEGEGNNFCQVVEVWPVFDYKPGHGVTKPKGKDGFATVEVSLENGHACSGTIQFRAVLTHPDGLKFSPAIGSSMSIPHAQDVKPKSDEGKTPDKSTETLTWTVTRLPGAEIAKFTLFLLVPPKYSHDCWDEVNQNIQIYAQKLD